MASNYNCTGCRCPASFTGVNTTPVSVSAIPGDTAQFTCMRHMTDCNGADFVDNVTNFATWDSSNTAVATVSSTGFSTAVGGGTANITASFTGSVYKYNYLLDTCDQSLVTLSASATCDVCDFTIAPTAVNAQCTGALESVNFAATVVPSLTTCNWNASQSSCSVTVPPTDHVEIAVGSPNCDFMITPVARVGYFAGPPFPDKTAGNMTVTFSLKLGTRQVTHSIVAPVTCP